MCYDYSGCLCYDNLLNLNLLNPEVKKSKKCFAIKNSQILLFLAKFLKDWYLNHSRQTIRSKVNFLLQKYFFLVQDTKGENGRWLQLEVEIPDC